MDIKGIIFDLRSFDQALVLVKITKTNEVYVSRHTLENYYKQASLDQLPLMAIKKTSER